jgi:mannose-6-phosphate isomerase-like protein (cupin superfamily)
MSHFDPQGLRYPDPVYLGESGEASAMYRPVTQAPELVYPNGTRAHYLIRGTETRGLFGIYRWEMGPDRGGPGPHFHRTITESFYIPSGSIRVFNGKDWIDTQPGDFIHVPEGGVHGFRNESGAPASMLIHFAPGAPREPYFEGNARFARDGRPSDEAMADFWREHDNVWLPEKE